MSALASHVGLKLASAPPATSTRPSCKRFEMPKVWPVEDTPAALQEFVDGSNNSAAATEVCRSSFVNPPLTRIRPSASGVASGRRRATDIGGPTVQAPVAGSYSAVALVVPFYVSPPTTSTRPSPSVTALGAKV